jgi:hypothetical protein
MRFWDGRTLPGRMRGECPRKWETRWSNHVERKKGGRRAVLLVIAHNARNLRKHLVPFFGRWQMREIGPEEVQRFVSSVKVSGKTAKNLFATIQMLWKSVRAWGYVAHDAVSDVVLPKRQRVARRFFPSRRFSAFLLLCLSLTTRSIGSQWKRPNAPKKENGSGVEPSKPLYLN